MFNQKNKTSLKEKDIVSHIVKNWEYYFKDTLLFYKTEYRVNPKWRCDILGYKVEKINNRDVKVPVYIEVKYNNNHRDLIYEFSKGLDFLTQRKPIYDTHLMLLIDKKSLDSTTIKYLENNKITYYVYELINDDLNTLTLHCVENFL